MSGSNVPPYIAYPYDASDLPMKASDLLSELSTQLDTNTEIHSIQRVIGAVPEYDGTTFIWSDWANLELFALADGSLIGSNSTTIYGSTL